MKKVLLFAALLSSNFLFSQFLTFDFAGATGNEATFASNFNAPGVAASTISRGPGISPQNNANRFNSDGFTTAATIDLTDFLEFTITPVNSTITINSITVTSERSSQGPTMFVIRASQDGFATFIGTNTVTNTGTATVTSTFTFTSPIMTTTPVTIRLFGFAAGVASGTFGPGEGAGNDIIVNGTVVLTPVPVKFANIKASKKASGIEVSFSNLTESDVVSYSIERSANGKQYSSIKELEPSKNDGGSADYSYTDAQPLSGNNLYRIKSTETNGKIAYSAIAKVDLDAKGLSLTIAPNPAISTELGLQISNLPSGNYKIRIFNNNAQVVGEQLLKHNGGSFSQTFPLNKLQSGMYYLELNGAVKMQKQFVVQ